MIPFRWLSIGTNIYKSMSSRMKNYAKKFETNDKWMLTFADSKVEMISFKFRDSREYGTEDFMMYENRWQFLKKGGYSYLKDVDTEPWGETDFKVKETMPWPGKDRSGYYITYSSNGSSFDPKTLKPKKREGMSSSGGTFTKKSFKDFVVVK